MLLSVTTIAAALILWNAPASEPVAEAKAVEPPVAVAKLEGRVLAHVDLDGDGTQELFVSLPDSCDDDGRCMLTVLQVRSEGGYRTLLPPTRMWDLSAAADEPAQGWTELVEARREGMAMDDITTVRWRFDGRAYGQVEGSEEALPTSPLWVSGNLPQPTSCALARVGSC